MTAKEEWFVLLYNIDREFKFELLLDTLGDKLLNTSNLSINSCSIQSER